MCKKIIPPMKAHMHQIMLLYYIWQLMGLGANGDDYRPILYGGAVFFFGIASALFVSGFWVKRRAMKRLLLFPGIYLILELLKLPVWDSSMHSIISGFVSIFSPLMLFLGSVFLFETAEERKGFLIRFLKWSALITVICMALTLLGMALNRPISLFNGTWIFGANYSASGRLVMVMLNLHQYSVGRIAVFFFFVNLYLLLEKAYPARYAVFAVTESIFLAAALLSGGRNVLGGLFLGLLLVIFLVIINQGCSKLRTLIMIAVIGVLGSIGLVVGTELLYSAVIHSIRDFWYGISTLTSRTTIWRSFFLLLQEHPSAAWIGLPRASIMPILNEYIALRDTVTVIHSGFMHTLCMMGFPGLLLLLTFLYRLNVNLFKLFLYDTAAVESKQQLLVIPVFLLLAQNLLENVLFTASARAELEPFFLLLAGYLFLCCDASEHENKAALPCSGQRACRMLSIAVCAIPILLLVYSHWAPPETENIDTNEQAKIYDHTAEIRTEDHIRLAPGITEEMLSPEHWRDPLHGDEVILTPEEIYELNRKNSHQLVSANGLSIDLGSIRDTLDGFFVRELVGSYSIPADSAQYQLKDTAVDHEYWQAQVRNAALDRIPELVHTAFGYSVAGATLCQLPSRDYIYKQNDPLVNALDFSDCQPFEPLVVVHESSDGEWYYVLLRDCAGWIEKESVALCQSREEWLLRQQEEFLLVTGEELRLEDEPLDSEISGLRLPMGTKLPLVRDESLPDSVNLRETYGCYVAKVAVRDEGGYLADKYCLIPMHSDVHIGYLPYTTDHILDQAFKCLGARYGWSGAHHGFDCSSYTQALYSCFGIEIPRGSQSQIFMEGTAHDSLNGMDERSRLERITSLPIGSLLYFSGHIMMYLGDADGVPYVISAVGSVCFRNEGEYQVTDPIMINSVTVNSLTDTFRSSNYSWLNAMSSYNTMRIP